MDDQNPGSVRSDRGSFAGARNAAGGTKPADATTLSKVGEVAQDAGSQVKKAAGALAADAGEQAKGFARKQIEAGADFLGNIGRSVTAAADTLEPDAPQMAGFVRDVASSVSDLSKTIRGQSPEALLDTASGYVRQNPALVLGAAAVCGFALTRLLQGGTWNASRTRPPGGPTTAARRSDAF